MIKIEKNRISIGYTNDNTPPLLVFEYHDEIHEERGQINTNLHIIRDRGKDGSTRSFMPKFTKEEFASLKLELLMPQLVK